MTSNELVTTQDLGLNAEGTAMPSIDEMSLEDVERLFIKKALQRYDGNVTAAAKALGLSRSAMYRRLEKHGL